MTEAAVSQKPIVIDLGKKKKKQIKRLRRGDGRLMDRVEETLEQLKVEKQITKDAQPVVVVVRQKPKKGRWGRGW